MAARDLKSLAWGWPELNDMLWRREVKGVEVPWVQGIGGGGVEDLSLDL